MSTETMGILSQVAANLVLVLVLLVGVLFVYGATKRWAVFFSLPDSSFLVVPRFVQRVAGERGLLFLYCSAGLVIASGALALLLYVNFQ